LWSGGADILADTTDVQNLVNDLGSRVKFWQVIDTYAHLDYVWAIDAYIKMYPNVMKFLTQTIPSS